ncbi:hypothetical protein AB0I81_18310 [Nonomuraea sp. NPDC050404]|uniref:hypothetical protein n=1 Tax=Nonomuraea sp. NPDC050404 TaxID=3155783 RepID=UPI0033DD5E81
MLYFWKATESRHRGAGGVAFSGNLAAARLVGALSRLAPGAGGFVERVALDKSARVPSYVHGPVLLTVHRDERTGALLFRRGA